MRRGDGWWDKYFLGLAQYAAGASKDPSTQVGAVIVDGHEVVATGYNGFPADMEDNPDFYYNRDEKLSRIIHAEMNALLFAKRDLSGCTIYTYPFMTCDRCTVHLLQAGVRDFVAPRVWGERADRWSASFQRTRQYVDECGGFLEEVDYE